MSETTTLGAWAELIERLDAAGTTARWSKLPGLTRLASAEQLRDWTAPGHPAGADEALRTLVGQAAVEGGGDSDATLVLLHLLWPGAIRLAHRIAHLVDDAEAVVVGELAAQIRAFPITRRTQAHAANLLLDTQTAVWRELEPYRTDRPNRPADVLVDSTEDGHSWVRRATRRRGDEDDIGLVDMLLWARRTGVVDELDLAALIEVEMARDVSKAPVDFVVRKTGWARRTVQRRSARALAALRASRGQYLAEAA